MKIKRTYEHGLRQKEQTNKEDRPVKKKKCIHTLLHMKNSFWDSRSYGVYV